MFFLSQRSDYCKWFNYFSIFKFVFILLVHFPLCFYYFITIISVIHLSFVNSQQLAYFKVIGVILLLLFPSTLEKGVCYPLIYSIFCNFPHIQLFESHNLFLTVLLVAQSTLGNLSIRDLQTSFLIVVFVPVSCSTYISCYDFVRYTIIELESWKGLLDSLVKRTRSRFMLKDCYNFWNIY